ncbi:MAG TPA: M23 family metallopeptidase [Thermoanaerobaculia bacterium]|nr:M23 family metallopeptidase [Thermoanaerobaculia bacterium]
MQIQFHPASGRGAVRTFSVEERGERVLILAAAAVLALALSLFLTVPVLAARRLAEKTTRAHSAELEAVQAGWNRAADGVRALAVRAQSWGDLLNRVAFLYRIPGAVWPRALNPERRLFADPRPDRLEEALEIYVRSLDRAEALVAAAERKDADLARRVPTISPIVGAAFEPSAYFGPRRSAWTGEEEFFLGVDLAAAEGSAVVASADGTVAFVGTVRRSMAGWFWRLGNVVVVSHAAGGATVYGHLKTVDVRRGQRIARGDRLGAVGSTGWAISSQLHYEYWRPENDKLLPTDPLFTTLDRRLGRAPLSLEQMEATSAPGPLDPLPGVQISAGSVGGPIQRSNPVRPPRSSPRPRKI